MTTLPSMSLVLPTRGSSGSGHWADTLDQNLTAIDGHTHEPGSGARVPSSGLDINADLTFNSSWAATALNRVSFSTIAAPPATTKSLFVFGDELYWKSAAGTSVKITDASSLNVAAFTGGFTGDFTAVAAEAAYDDANRRYTFKQGGGTNWARVAAGALRLFEFSTSETVYVEQVAPAALGGSYTVIWPTALPAGLRPLQIDNTGALSAASTAFAFPALPSSTRPLQIDNAGAASAGYTNTYGFHASLANFAAGGTAAFAASGTVVSLNTTGANAAHCPIIVPAGSTITAWTLFLNKTQAGTISAACVEETLATGATATVGATQSNNVNNPGNITLGQTGLSFATQSGRSYVINVTGSTNSGDSVYGWQVVVA